MAPKTFYDAGEVQKKVTETAEKTFKTLQEGDGSSLNRHEFLGAATPDGYSLEHGATNTRQLQQDWRRSKAAIENDPVWLEKFHHDPR